MPPTIGPQQTPRTHHVTQSYTPPPQANAGEAEADRLMDLYNPTVGHQDRPLTQRDMMRSVNGEDEQQSLRANNGEGRLIVVYQGRPGAGTTVTVHGINGTPEDMAAIDQRAAEKGQTVLDFAYDSHHRRMADASHDLAGELSRWQDAHPGENLTVDAHSSGGRIATGALQEMSSGDGVKNHTQLNLLAPILGGYAGANSAMLAPSFIARQIKNAEPGKDVGTWSGFQHRLETTNMSPNVSTTAFVGTNDKYQDLSSEHYQAAASRIQARMVPVPDADHMGILDAFASDTLH